jgi:hypothetical protein
MKLAKLFAILIGAITSVSVLADDDNVVHFDTSTGILSLPGVIVNGVQYNGIDVKLKDVEVTRVGLTSQTLNQPCPNSFRADQFDAISIGMTLDQVNAIMGCQYTLPTSPLARLDAGYSWMPIAWRAGLSFVTVVFDIKSGKVAPAPDGSFGGQFKF